MGRARRPVNQFAPKDPERGLKNRRRVGLRLFKEALKYDHKVD
jgi:hypothetical protein